MVAENSWGYGFASCSLVINAFCFVLCSCFAGKHLNVIWEKAQIAQIANARKDKIEEDIRLKLDSLIIRHCTHLSVLMFWLQTALMLVLRVLMFVRANDLFPCHKMAICYGLVLVFAKSAMYGVFTARLCLGFYDTLYAYCKRFIRILHAVIVTILLIFTMAMPLSANGSDEDTHYAANGRHVDEKSGKLSIANCVGNNWVKELLVAVALVDVLFFVLAIGLFTRPLRKMSKERAEMDSEMECTGATLPVPLSPEHSFESLRLKYITLLSGFAIASTFVGLALFLSTHMADFIAIDNTVNLACVLAMSCEWKACYWRVCGPLLRCLSHSQWFEEHNAANVKVLSTSIHQSVSDELPILHEEYNF